MFLDLTAQRVYEVLCARKNVAFDSDNTIAKEQVHGPGRSSSCPPPVDELLPARSRTATGSPSPSTFAIGRSEDSRSSVMPSRTVVVGSSGRTTLPNFFSLLEVHLEACGGLEEVAEACKYDGQKTVALRWEVASRSRGLRRCLPREGCGSRTVLLSRMSRFLI